MRLSPPAKGAIALALVLAAVVYLAIVEVAINAGRIHHGVDVEGLDVGGLNPQEAVDLLRETGDEMKESPMIFTAEGFDCRFTPEQVGWGPQPADTVNAAMAVGRSGSFVESFRERWRAWTGGVTIGWQGSTDPARVGRELNRCEKASEGLGVQIDRPRLRYLIKRTIPRWPRGPVELPLEA